MPEQNNSGPLLGQTDNRVETALNTKMDVGNRYDMFVVIALLLAIIPWPYLYYIFLRWLVFGTCISWLRSAGNRQHSRWATIYLIIGALYNPFIPFSTHKLVWCVINIAAACLIAASPSVRKRKPEQGTQHPEVTLLQLVEQEPARHVHAVNVTALAENLYENVPIFSPGTSALECHLTPKSVQSTNAALFEEQDLLSAIEMKHRLALSYAANGQVALASQTFDEALKLVTPVSQEIFEKIKQDGEDFKKQHLLNEIETKHRLAIKYEADNQIALASQTFDEALRLARIICSDAILKRINQAHDEFNQRKWSNPITKNLTFPEEPLTDDVTLPRPNEPRIEIDWSGRNSTSSCVTSSPSNPTMSEPAKPEYLFDASNLTPHVVPQVVKLESVKSTNADLLNEQHLLSVIETKYRLAIAHAADCQFALACQTFEEALDLATPFGPAASFEALKRDYDLFKQQLMLNEVQTKHELELTDNKIALASQTFDGVLRLVAPLTAGSFFESVTQTSKPKDLEFPEESSFEHITFQSAEQPQTKINWSERAVNFSTTEKQMTAEPQDMSATDVKEEQRSTACRNCRAEITMLAKFCPYCGTTCDARLLE